MNIHVSKFPRRHDSFLSKITIDDFETTTLYQNSPLCCYFCLTVPLGSVLWDFEKSMENVKVTNPRYLYDF